MIVKLLVLAAVLYLVYTVFFKRRLNNKSKDSSEEVDTMVECPTCKTYVARDDAILSNGKYYCSKECLAK